MFAHSLEIDLTVFNVRSLRFVAPNTLAMIPFTPVFLRIYCKRNNVTVFRARRNAS